MLEGEDNFAAEIPIDHDGTGALKRRTVAHTCPAQHAIRFAGPGVEFEFKWQPTGRTLRIGKEINLLPARPAQDARAFDGGVTRRALRRQQDVQRPAGDVPEMGSVYGAAPLCHTCTMTDSITVFNRRAVRRHRDRAARGGGEDSDLLFRESAERLLDRLDDVTRSFPLALEFGCRSGEMGKTLRGRSGIDTLVQCDLSEAMAAQAGGMALAADEEALPFTDAVFDLVIGNLSLHWVNDLPGALIQMRRALKPDGLFLAAMFGGDTLIELRQALAEAEIAEEDGLSPRVSPMAEVRDLGGLLQRAGLALPVVDSETLTVMYPDPMALMADLRAMGETNAAVESRKGFTRPATLAAAAARYSDLFATSDGAIPATFQIITLTGWAPDASQQQPLQPGSATSRLADALDAEEHPLPDKARPT